MILCLVFRPLGRASVLRSCSFAAASAAGAAAQPPVAVRCISVASSLHSNAYRASAIAAATQPISKPKPVKEVKGVDINSITMGAEGETAESETTDCAAAARGAPRVEAGDGRAAGERDKQKATSQLFRHSCDCAVA